MLKKNAKQQTRLEQVIAGKRAQVEEEIGWLQKAFKLACAMGYESVAERPQILEKAIETCSRDNAIGMGDSYKPFDPDFYYPASDEVLQSEVVRFCKHEKLPYEPQLKLDLAG